MRNMARGMAGTRFRAILFFLLNRYWTDILRAFYGKSRWRAWKTTWLASPRTGLRAARKSANFQRTHGMV
jgi:hypothetical protein